MSRDAPLCPDCETSLVESSSERGDYFCTNCTTPVRSRDAIRYCSSCGENEATTVEGECPECALPENDGMIWGTQPVSEYEDQFTARHCPNCANLSIPMNFVPVPLHDGDGNYYTGDACPRCQELLYRRRPPEDLTVSEEEKEIAKLDPAPPDEFTKLEVMDPTSASEED